MSADKPETRRWFGTDADLVACTASAYTGGKRCRWCNGELTGRRTRWCSDECAAAYQHNHWWTSARNAALRRDDCTCLDCGAHNDPHRIRSVVLQVHHVTPVMGRHADTGCHHHLDGLRTLCAACHLAAHAAIREAERRLPEPLFAADQAGSEGPVPLTNGDRSFAPD